MKLKKFDHMDCAIAQTLNVVGERWSLLIIRDIFMGVRQFEQIRESLGIARNVLSARLTQLLEAGIISKNQLDGRSAEYRLTEKGLDLHIVLISLTHWGEKHIGKEEGERVIFLDRETGDPIAPMCVRNKKGDPLSARQIAPVAGPGLDTHKNSARK